MMFMGVEMDIKKVREAFEKLPEIRDSLSEHIVFIGNKYTTPNPDFYDLVNWLNGAWYAWQAKAQAVLEGFVLVPKEPYAYLIKHKLWNKNSQPEIYLADDFVGDDGVEREKLIVCIPLYKGEDEAQ